MLAKRHQRRPSVLSECTACPTGNRAHLASLPVALCLAWSTRRGPVLARDTGADTLPPPLLTAIAIAIAIALAIAFA